MSHRMAKPTQRDGRVVAQSGATATTSAAAVVSSATIATAIPNPGERLSRA